MDPWGDDGGMLPCYQPTTPSHTTQLEEGQTHPTYPAATPGLIQHPAVYSAATANEPDMYHPGSPDMSAPFPSSFLFQSMAGMAQQMANAGAGKGPMLAALKASLPALAQGALPPVLQQGGVPAVGAPTGMLEGGGAQQAAPGKVGYFPVILFVAAIGDGRLCEASEAPGGPEALGNEMQQLKVTERWKLLLEKVPKEQFFTLDMPGEGRIELKLRVFISNSDDSRAIEAYLKLFPDQKPAPFVVLCDCLAVAAAYNTANMDPATDSAVADRLRKQSKSRGVKFIREYLADFTSNGITLPLLRGHEGPFAIQSRITEVAKRQFTPIDHGFVSSAMVFRAADRTTTGVGQSSATDALLDGVAPLPVKAKKPRSSVEGSGGGKKAKAQKGGEGGGSVVRGDDSMSIGMLLSGSGGGEGFDGAEGGGGGGFEEAAHLLSVAGGEGAFGLGPSSKHQKSPKKKKEGGAGGGATAADREKHRFACDAVVESKFLGAEVYVNGTGNAKDSRTYGTLRKGADLFLKVEAEGRTYGLNEFCMMALNTKKRPRDSIHITRTGKSLTEEAEAVVGPMKITEGAAVGTEGGGEKRSSTGGGSAGGEGAGPAKKKKKKIDGAALAEAKAVFQASAEYALEDEGWMPYDQERVDFTTVMAEEDDQEKSEKLRNIKSKKKCEKLIDFLKKHKDSYDFVVPVNLEEFPDYLSIVQTPMDLTTIKGKHENGDYAHHKDFAEDVRLVWKNAMAYNKEGDEVYVIAEKLSNLFEERYAAILRQEEEDKEQTNKPQLPETLLQVPQRHIDEWAIFDENGKFLPPWFGSDAKFPGGVCGTLTVPEGCYDVLPLKIRLESPDQWHARCLDGLGCRVPQYWVKSDLCWYRLGNPLDSYTSFLHEESAWLMATYRIASYLTQTPKATFEDVVKVLEGKNWRRTSEPAKLLPFSMDMVYEKADHIAEEICSVNDKLASHKFCQTLVSRSKKPPQDKDKGRASGSRAGAGGDGGHRKKKKSGDSGEGGDQKVERTVYGANFGWMYREGMSKEELEVRSVLHETIKKLEKKHRRKVALEQAASDWRCQWCQVPLAESGGRCPGPDGPSTLCCACGSRFRNGHTHPPIQDPQGFYVCELCNKKFESIRGLGSHKRGCNGTGWRCEWCSCTQETSGGKFNGPNGSKTLCSSCGSRFRNGHVAPPLQDAEGKYVCPLCSKKFDSLVSVGGHKRFCDGGFWRCAWCKVPHEESGGKSPGPNGPKTLCSPCGSRFRNGHTGPPQKDAQGNFVCDDCGKAFDSISGLGGHRRFCENLARKGAKGPVLMEDLEFWEGKKFEGSYIEMPLGGQGIVGGNEVSSDLQNELVQVWDCTTFILTEVMQQTMPCDWPTFLDVVLHPQLMKHRESLAHIHMSLIEVLYMELPGADGATIFKGRPLNTYTWQEQLRQYLAMETADLRYTLCANISEDDAKLAIPHRRTEARRLGALVRALGETDYEDLPLATRLDVFSTLCALALDSTMTRKYLDHSIDDTAKLASRKREEYSQRLREMEQQFSAQKAVASNTGAPGTPAADGEGGGARGASATPAPDEVGSLVAGLEKGLDAGVAGSGDAMAVDGEGGTGGTPTKEDGGVGEGADGKEVERDKRKGRKMDLKALREAEDHEREQLDNRYKVLKLEVGTVRRECLGMDRHCRRYWQLGMVESGRLGPPTEPFSLWIEPCPSDKKQRGGGPAADCSDWIQVESLQELRRVISALSERGTRESALKMKLDSMKDILEKAYADSRPKEGMAGGGLVGGAKSEQEEEIVEEEELLRLSVLGPPPSVEAEEEVEIRVRDRDGGEEEGGRSLRKKVKASIKDDTDSDRDMDEDDHSESRSSPAPASEPPVEEMEVGELEGVKGKDKEKAALHGLPIRELTFQSRALTSLRVRGVHSPGDVFVRRELERRAKWLAKEAVKKEIVEDRMEEATAQGRAGDVKMEDALEGDGGDKPISDGGAVEGEAETSKPDAAIEKDEVQGQGGVAKLEVKAEVHEGAEPLTSEKAKEDGARMSEDTKPLATATPALPPPVRKPFNGARVMVLHQDGQWYGGFLSFLNDDDEGKWHVIFEDNEEDDLFVNSGECTVVSVKEAAPADGVCLAHGILRIKRDMLDMCAALPTQDTLWWARRKHVWEADVRNARSVSQLNVLLHEFGRCVKSDLREKWWCPWDGFEVPQAGAQQVTSVRCRYTEGGSSWRCKSAAIPGKSVCKRHLKKQLASAGVAGFKVIMRPSDNPEGLKNVKLEEGMDVEVFYPRDNEWYQAKVMSVNKKGAPKVAYINAGDEGQVTNTSTTEVVTDKKRLRLPEKAEGEGEKEGHSKEDEDGEEDEDEHGEEEKGLIMANEEVVTSASVLLRIHSLDQALRYADEIHHDPPPKKTPAKRGRKKK